MAPNVTGSVCLIQKDDENEKLVDSPEERDVQKPKEPEAPFILKWESVISIFLAHCVAVYGFITFPYIQKWRTFLWTLVMGFYAGFGVTMGAHRLWCHRTYKANLPLRILLMFAFMASGQNSIYKWVRDHRVHHKYSETHADPHNSNRGFFFSHVGWLMLKKHPEVIAKGRKIDMSDITNDPVCAFSERYFLILKGLFAFVIPVVVPVMFWNEEWKYSILVMMARYMYSLNSTWSVNSVAHIWGKKPYDKNIAPVENKFVAYVAFGEGWHNYHHTFPYDYRAAEIGGGRVNMTTSVIDFFAKIGWAWDLKYPSDQLIHSTITKRGDGSYVDDAIEDKTSTNNKSEKNDQD